MSRWHVFQIILLYVDHSRANALGNITMDGEPFLMVPFGTESHMYNKSPGRHLSFYSEILNKILLWKFTFALIKYQQFLFVKINNKKRFLIHASSVTLQISKSFCSQIALRKFYFNSSSVQLLLPPLMRFFTERKSYYVTSARELWPFIKVNILQSRLILMGKWCFAVEKF